MITLGQQKADVAARKADAASRTPEKQNVVARAAAHQPVPVSGLSPSDQAIRVAQARTDYLTDLLWLIRFGCDNCKFEKLVAPADFVGGERLCTCLCCGWQDTQLEEEDD